MDDILTYKVTRNVNGVKDELFFSTWDSGFVQFSDWVKKEKSSLASTGVKFDERGQVQDKAFSVSGFSNDGQSAAWHIWHNKKSCSYNAIISLGYRPNT